jgi:hypothetical protein
LALIGPLPSIGSPSALTTRPSSSGPTGTFEDAAGGLGGVAFAQVLVVAQHHGADRVALQVQRQREGVVRQLDHFALHHVGQAVDAHDAVGHRGDGAFVARFGAESLTFSMRVLISSLISDGLSVVVAILVSLVPALPPARFK